ncbi:MAG TPA: hypothetical protein VIL85_27440 [Thermomicrobiales bacterium]
MQVVTCPGGVTSADPVVRATAEMTTPDLAAIAALDAALAACGIDVGTVEEVRRCPLTGARS